MKMISAKYLGHLALIEIFENNGGKLSDNNNIGSSMYRNDYQDPGYRCILEDDSICRICTKGQLEGKVVENLSRYIEDNWCFRYVYKRFYWDSTSTIRFIITINYVQDEDKFGNPVYMSYHTERSEITLFTDGGTITTSIDDGNTLGLKADLCVYDGSIESCFNGNIELDLENNHVRIEEE